MIAECQLLDPARLDQVYGGTAAVKVNGQDAAPLDPDRGLSRVGQDGPGGGRPGVGRVPDLKTPELVDVAAEYEARPAPVQQIREAVTGRRWHEAVARSGRH